MTSNPEQQQPAAAAAAVTNSEQQPDARFHVDEAALETVRTEAKWMQNPKYFQQVALSPSAIIKIMMHCQSGVDKGIQKGGTCVRIINGGVERASEIACS